MVKNTTYKKVTFYDLTHNNQQRCDIYNETGFIYTLWRMSKKSGKKAAATTMAEKNMFGIF